VIVVNRQKESDVTTVASLESGARAAQDYMKLFVARKMTRNTTLNKVLNYRSCCRRIVNTNMFGEATA